MPRKYSLILVAVLVLAGCQPLEYTARDAIASAKGALDYYKGTYQCSTPQFAPAACLAIARAVAAKDLAIDALEVYCAGPAFDSGGPCQPSPDPDARRAAAIKLQAFTKQLNQAMLDLNRALGRPR